MQVQIRRECPGWRTSIHKVGRTSMQCICIGGTCSHKHKTLRKDSQWFEAHPCEICKGLGYIEEWVQFYTLLDEYNVERI